MLRPTVNLSGCVGLEKVPSGQLMVVIELSTRIAAPLERVFDLARSIDLHMASTNWTGEQAIAGVTHGLIGPDQEVTWRGRHFGFMVRHTSRITVYQRPVHFQDAMVRGLFRTFQHDHHFEAVLDKTVMSDEMRFSAPLGPLGILAERIALERHMRDLLERRNVCIQRVAESDEWEKFLL
jgi:ligand-binding SRPBCC domain-containing protein